MNQRSFLCTVCTRAVTAPMAEPASAQAAIGGELTAIPAVQNEPESAFF